MYSELIIRHFWSKVDKSDPGGCWPWTMRDGAHVVGYGRFSALGLNIPAHRLSYEINVGEIPEGLVIDHLCRNRGCVNPSHLEPVTNKENILRGVGMTATNLAKTHCDNGHPFDKENTRSAKTRFGTSRRCMTCQKLSNERINQKRYESSPARSEKTHCGAGHLLTAENIYLRRDGRQKCRQCMRDNDKRHYARNALKNALAQPAPEQGEG